MINNFFICSYQPLKQILTVIGFLSAGKPILSPRLRRLNITCLQKHKEMLLDELEPLDFCDLLFEERAIEIPVHDKITETSRRVKQTEYLLETVQENKNDCFHFFLYILQKEEYMSVLEKLKKPCSKHIRSGKFYLYIRNSLVKRASKEIFNRSSKLFFP